MLQSLAPLAGCGLMMLACMAVMARGHRNEPISPEDEITALRCEVAQLRHLDEQRHPTGGEEPAPSRGTVLPAGPLTGATGTTATSIPEPPA
jgi:hypothetical protein